jgi:hypothetical protein
MIGVGRGARGEETEGFLKSGRIVILICSLVWSSGNARLYFSLNSIDFAIFWSMQKEVSQVFFR